jgi:hypothetical protein
MGSTKKKDKCSIEWCEKPKKRYQGQIDSRFCTTHVCNATITAFLCKMYKDMRARVTGTKTGAVADRSSHLYVGKPIVARDLFMTWAKNHPDFLALYKRYVMSKFERRLAPSLNRMDSKKGYVFGNMEWMSSGQNSGLSGTVKKMNNHERKVIYKVLGVKA